MSKLTEVNAEELGRPIFENIIDAHVKVSYSQLTQDFSKEFQKVLSADRFQEALDDELISLGDVSKIDYLGSLQREDEVLQLLWKVRFEKSKEDLLWQLYLQPNNDKIEVVALWFE